MCVFLGTIWGSFSQILLFISIEKNAPASWLYPLLIIYIAVFERQDIVLYLTWRKTNFIYYRAILNCCDSILYWFTKFVREKLYIEFLFSNSYSMFSFKLRTSFVNDPLHLRVSARIVIQILIHAWILMWSKVMVTWLSMKSMKYWIITIGLEFAVWSFVCDHNCRAILEM